MVGLAKESHVNRNRVVAGVILMAVLIAMVLFATTFLTREWKSRQPQVGQRSIVPRLRYCASDEARPCVVSFELDPEGRMIINLLAERSSPDFEIRIRHAQGEKLYMCRRVRLRSIHVSCIGDVLPVGESMQFVIVATEENALLAEGKFPIIGIALATPEYAATPTSVPFFERPPR